MIFTTKTAFVVFLCMASTTVIARENDDNAEAGSSFSQTSPLRSRASQNEAEKNRRLSLVNDFTNGDELYVTDATMKGGEPAPVHAPVWAPHAWAPYAAPVYHPSDDDDDDDSGKKGGKKGGESGGKKGGESAGKKGGGYDGKKGGYGDDDDDSGKKGGKKGGYGDDVSSVCCLVRLVLC